MDDADAGRHDLERVERLHPPLHELVALGVALELELHVEVERVGAAVVVDHHRMVDDEVDRHERLDRLRVPAHVGGDVAHRGEVGQQRHAGEILQHDARDDERDLRGARAGGRPVRDFLHVLLGDLLAVAVAQHAFEHDADRHRQPRDAADAGRLERGQRVELAGGAGGELERLERVVQVVRHVGSRGSWDESERSERRPSPSSRPSNCGCSSSGRSAASCRPAAGLPCSRRRACRR